MNLRQLSMQLGFNNGDEHPAYPDTYSDLPVSQTLWARGLYLPGGPDLTRVQVETMVETLLLCRRN